MSGKKEWISRRAAVPIPSNIAEGKAIGGRNYRRHVKLALGSEAELQRQIELARRLKIVGEPEAKELSQRRSEVGRMLVGLLKRLSGRFNDMRRPDHSKSRWPDDLLTC